MKFCYIDESGAGSEPVLIMSGIIVDASRMHITKRDFNSFLKSLSSLCSREITEFHARDFYNGNGPWRRMDGKKRSDVIDFLLDWLSKRKHCVTFSAIDKAKFNEKINNCDYCKELKTPWRAAAFHLALQIQKFHQKKKKAKGHTALIFDREIKEEKPLTILINKPPKWADDFYKNKNSKKESFDQIVDVPFFADSKHVLLLQMADLVAYLLRLKAELDLGRKSKYEDEKEKVAEWINLISSLLISTSYRYPSRTASICARLFNELCPESLASL